jgi:AcrR family transcriptional regulator
MANITKEILVSKARTLFAMNGYEGFTMRILAKESGVGLSSIYHFFADKDVLLKYIFDDVSKQLGVERYKLAKRHSASQMLYDRILFQFAHIEKIIYVQKYYFHFRKDFMKSNSGFTPVKAYLHIDEVIRFGVKKHQFECAEDEIDQKAKVITHGINGFLLEYYPQVPMQSELKKIATSIHIFMMRSLTNKEVVMK